MAGENMSKLPGGGEVLRRLKEAGFKAYCVGGCVRDSVMGRPCHDIDITTDARPEEVIAVFGEKDTVPTGIRFGTVTVLREFEVTTFRIDGEYSDHRSPDNVDFTGSLEEDLSRRDFTMNAMAMDENGCITDPWEGRRDIERKVIRCVGDPEKRFEEDALRMLRAMRFASQLGFTIDPESARQIHAMKSGLRDIAQERIRDELDKLLCGPACAQVLIDYSDVIGEFIPEIVPCIGLDQRTPYHIYTVWEHIARAVESAPEDDLFLRRTLFFHDIGKPACARYDETGRGHFKGHDAVGAAMTAEIMTRMRWDKKTVSRTVELIARHSVKLRDRIGVRQMMREIGDEAFFRLMELKKCDNLGKAPFVAEENVFFDKLISEGRRIVSQDLCRSVKGLEVSGQELADLGLKGQEIGAALEELLDKVITEELPNSREELIGYIRRCKG